MVKLIEVTGSSIAQKQRSKQKATRNDLLLDLADFSLAKGCGT